MKFSTFKLHTRGLASDIVQSVKAVVAYAEQHKERHIHCMALSEFCKLVGFPLDTTRAQIVKVMSRAGKATASLRIVDVSLPIKKVVFAGSWPVFDYIVITHAQISFEVCPRMWTWESLLEQVKP